MLVPYCYFLWVTFQLLLLFSSDKFLRQIIIALTFYSLELNLGPLIINLFFNLFLGAECGVNADVEKHLELGKKLLAAGQLADALSQFHAAVGMYLGSKKLSGHLSKF